MILVPADVAAAYARYLGRPTCTAATIRWWAATGRLPRRGKDGRRVLYALEDVESLCSDQHQQ